MQRAGAAECDEREVARVEPLLDRDDSKRAHHLRVHDVDHAARIDGSQRALRLPVSSSIPPGGVGGRRPRSRLASVTVACTPPRP